MLISKKMNDALNTQIGNEFGASLQYVSIGSHFGRESLPELAAHFLRQADEERMHAMKLVQYVVDAGGQVVIPAISAPKSEFKTAEEAVKLSLDWELTVTKQINGLVDLAIAESDHISRNFLQWFVNEQLEEVSSMDQLLSIVRRAGEAGLLFVEEYLARRGAPTVASAGAGGSAE
ncbi:MAG TPA: ferritin [Candidatus Eisenbacteria bacterium]|nr:ferritin [Candidatus Eisenbacteria bacterium]